MSLSELPDEIVIEIILFLPLRDYPSICVSSRRLNELARSEPMIQQLAMNVTLLDGKHRILTKHEDVLVAFGCDSYHEFLKIFSGKKVDGLYGRRGGVKDSVMSKFGCIKGKELQKFLSYSYSFEDKDITQKHYDLLGIMFTRKVYNEKVKVMEFPPVEFLKVTYGFNPFHQGEKWMVFMTTSTQAKDGKTIFSLHYQRSWSSQEVYSVNFVRKRENFLVSEIYFHKKRDYVPGGNDLEKLCLDDFGVITRFIGLFLKYEAPFSMKRDYFLS